MADALAQFTRDRGAYTRKSKRKSCNWLWPSPARFCTAKRRSIRCLLAGIVRVALEKIEGATGVVLRVHPRVAADWRRYLASRMDPGDLPGDRRRSCARAGTLRARDFHGQRAARSRGAAQGNRAGVDGFAGGASAGECMTEHARRTPTGTLPGASGNLRGIALAGAGDAGGRSAGRVGGAFLFGGGDLPD